MLGRAASCCDLLRLSPTPGDSSEDDDLFDEQNAKRRVQFIIGCARQEVLLSSFLFYKVSIQERVNLACIIFVQSFFNTRTCEVALYHFRTKFLQYKNV